MLVPRVSKQFMKITKKNRKEIREKKEQALQADAVKCVKITSMFAAARPSSAPAAEADDGCGNKSTGAHREEIGNKERERDDGVSAEPALLR